MARTVPSLSPPSSSVSPLSPAPQVEVRAQRASKPTPPRQLVLHVHLADTAIARLEQTRSPVSVAQVKTSCTHPDTTVVIQPVIDLAGTPHTEAYEIPDLIRDQVILREHTCVFPWCTRPARSSHGALDLDHRDP